MRAQGNNNLDVKLLTKLINILDYKIILTISPS